MKKDQPLNTDNSSPFSDLELELRKLQPSMPDSLRLRQDEIYFQLGYQTGKESARKWQFSVWILALVTITSWMVPGILNPQKTSDMIKEHSIDRLDNSLELTNLDHDQNIHDSEFIIKSKTDNETVSEISKTKTKTKTKNTAKSDHSALSSSAFHLFALMQQLNPPEVLHPTGAYSEYRERAMIIGTDALPEFKMASNNAVNKGSDTKENPDNYTIFKKVEWRSILF